MFKQVFSVLCLKRYLFVSGVDLRVALADGFCLSTLNYTMYSDCTMYGAPNHLVLRFRLFW